ncbi:hypothetical protein [Vibrio barjaei]|uniref:capsular polysaccharide export protein, LipB/KpsS family n=1 Tax=Vibrio barjaei TaxID=1676683 RepID=UPI002283CDAA|nr:hypothetical protein [Vibrio barjaei]MCY9872343.1 hypothetical protein [Vibrio barjaei]
MLSLFSTHLFSSTNKKTIFALKVHRWKRNYIKKVYDEYNWFFIPRFLSINVLERIIKNIDCAVLVWGYGENPAISNLCKKLKVPLWRMEDGFVRGRGLGAHRNLPQSLVIDKSGTLYFDCRSRSSLDVLIQTTEPTRDLLKLAQSHINTIQRSGVSKYNLVPLSNKKTPSRLQTSTKRKILVIGQVEDDASIKLSGCGFDNGMLLNLAHKTHPNADIFFKVHPDILAGKRKIKTPMNDIRKIAHLIDSSVTLKDCFELCDEVFTITSLSGFEALLHGKPVTVAGQPFYSGYGLTNDINPITRYTNRKVTILDIFVCAYMLYPDYFDSNSCKRSTLQKTLLSLCTNQDRCDRL